MKVKAAVAYAPEQPLSLEEVDLDDPRPDEILVEIHAVGICHTDIANRDQHLPHPLPAVFGHEGAGVVLATGASVKKVKPGDRVLLTFLSCGECVSCRDDAPAYCDRMPELNGLGTRPDGSHTLHGADQDISSNFFGQSSFATHAIAYERNVVPAPDDVPLHRLAPFGCGIQTGAGGVMRSLACKPGSSILVVGGGPVGLSAVMGAAIQGCETIILSEPHPTRRELGLDLGATHVMDPMAQDLVETVKSITPRGVDYVFDTSGIPDVIDQAIQSMAPLGRIGLVGVPRDMTALLNTNLIMLVGAGHSVRGIVEGDSNVDSFLGELIDHHRSGRLPVDKLIKLFPFEAINEAIDASLKGDCLKAVLVTKAGQAAEKVQFGKT